MERLISQPSGTATAVAIKNLHDTTKECMLALNNLGVDTESWDPLLLHILIKKLDRGTHIRFEQSISSPKELLNIDEFLTFLENQFQSIESLGQKERPSNAVRAVSSVVTQEKKTSSNNCKLCNSGRHPLYYCDQFLKMTPNDRLNWVKRQRLCFNCFKSAHTGQKCSSRCCSKCSKKHNSLLHLEAKKQQAQQQAQL